ncbi:LuxR C-terminal-related transcriptional regulator [Pseudonocardia acaciae]|uniref:LuxR C-terminal-related transcriptional regulator n=1 Tax=Pseudonocardia acaciae TaxID=551276 RepID=UPI000684E127|nr:response regulator transcription factor [Pseudonocardia acaciae]
MRFEMNGDRVSVAIVDDEPLSRRGLASIIDQEDDFSVLADTVSADAARTISTLYPDVVLLVSDASAAKVVAQLRSLSTVSPRSRFVVLASQDEPRRVRHLVTAGAQAYILRSAAPSELVTAIRVVSGESGRVMLSVSRRTVHALNDGDNTTLSEREIEVLDLVAAGKRNVEISSTLYIAEGTVKRHLTNIYAKLGATSRTDAIRRAREQGLELR